MPRSLSPVAISVTSDVERLCSLPETAILSSVNFRQISSFCAATAPRLPPRFNSTDTDLTAIDGEEMTLPCPSFGVPEPRSVWYRDGRRRVYPGPTVHLGGDGALTLTPARLHDAGSFTCVAISEAGTAQLNVTLTVYVPPSIREEPDPVVALRGRPARLSCEATGIPAPTVLWFKADPRGRKVLVGIGSFLDFPDGVTSEHQGCYVCVAENEAGSQERSVVLDVIG
ncbi:hypothetical protein HPB48_020981 [Haemaphysalis longicornis]|uniref:Ig-like domain-containing protein n=1 Tax=Haemaphysalis longicornis TaxID=44386 RepID=A0A9J6FCF9_HAELO|nr:hypothetical protein HPB48_020981 [Haemaphysalis longicornis]